MIKTVDNILEYFINKNIDYELLSYNESNSTKTYLLQFKNYCLIIKKRKRSKQLQISTYTFLDDSVKTCVINNNGITLVEFEQYIKIAIEHINTESIRFKKCNEQKDEQDKINNQIKLTTELSKIIRDDLFRQGIQCEIEYWTDRDGVIPTNTLLFSNKDKFYSYYYSVNNMSYELENIYIRKDLGYCDTCNEHHMTFSIL